MPVGSDDPRGGQRAGTGAGTDVENLIAQRNPCPSNEGLTRRTPDEGVTRSKSGLVELKISAMLGPGMGSA